MTRLLRQISSGEKYTAMLWEEWTFGSRQMSYRSKALVTGTSLPCLLRRIKPSKEACSGRSRLLSVWSSPLYSTYHVTPPSTQPRNKSRNTIMPETTDTAIAATSPECFLLTRVPVEIHQSIYRYAFTGSKVTATFSRDARTYAFIATNHQQLLFGCRQTYVEGKAIYWEETVIAAARHDPHSLVGNNTRFLSDNLSNFTKAPLRHLREILPGYDTKDLLNQFPRLQRANYEKLTSKLHRRNFSLLIHISVKSSAIRGYSWNMDC